MRDKFIPKSNDNKTVTSIRLETRMLDKIDKIAGQNNLSRNECIIQMLSFVLERADIDDIKIKKES